MTSFIIRLTRRHRLGSDDEGDLWSLNVMETLAIWTVMILGTTLWIFGLIILGKVLRGEL